MVLDEMVYEVICSRSSLYLPVPLVNCLSLDNRQS